VAAGDVASWYNPLFETRMRVEHWTNAAEQAEAAARALLQGDDAAPYAPVPYFWSDQFGTKLQHIGHCLNTDEMRVVEGEVAESRFVAAWGRAGTTVAALCVNRPNRTIPYRSAVADRAPFPPNLRQ
jgi:NADPH-dependent 2,4-dienoyl-CoA reductase/sulfur reductase-like enzyme